MQTTMKEFVAATAVEHGVPGLAVGVWDNGRQLFSCHGVTSLENPLLVDEDTLFTIGSVTKTFTATALVRLVADGRVELDAPVRRYVPEFELADAGAADEITVWNLLSHTSGLEWGRLVDTGAGDDALARAVAALADLELLATPGGSASYSHAGFILAGRIIENVTGLPFETAVAELVLAPVGLTRSHFHLDEAITRRLAVGHERGPDGTLAIARRWKGSRGDNPGSGLASTASDLLRWARFHLGDGGTDDGAQLLPADLLGSMKRPAVALRGAGSLGHALGIGWFLREIDGADAIGHGGCGFGQAAELLLIPEHDFAVVALANQDPDGVSANRAVVRFVLEHYLGLVDRAPEPLDYCKVRAWEAAGSYAIDAVTVTVHDDGSRLRLGAAVKPAVRAACGPDLPADHPPAAIGLLPNDEYVVTEGDLAGRRGHFVRNAHGVIVGLDLAGRLFPRVAALGAAAA